MQGQEHIIEGRILTLLGQLEAVNGRCTTMIKRAPSGAEITQQADAIVRDYQTIVRLANEIKALDIREEAITIQVEARVQYLMAEIIKLIEREL